MIRWRSVCFALFLLAEIASFFSMQIVVMGVLALAYLLWWSIDRGMRRY